jgi:hypothetical protein
MSSTDVTGRTSPPAVTPHYGSTVPNPSDAPGGRGTKCVTGLGFFKTVQGILNIVIIVSKDLFLSNNEFIFKNIIDCNCLYTYKCWCI